MLSNPEKRFRFIARVLLLCLTAGAAGLAAGEAEDLKPGKHRQIACAQKPEYHYTLYIPKSYAERADAAFPIVYISDPCGAPGSFGLEGWAERNHVILALIHESKNGMKDTQIAEIQNAVLDATAATLRVYPCLRFSMGMSGAGWASMLMAIKHKDAWGGVLCMGHGGSGLVVPKPTPIAFIHGEADDVHPLSVAKAGHAKHKQNPCKVLIVPGLGHQPGSTEQIEAMLTWLLWSAKFGNKGISKAERKAYEKELDGLIAALEKTEDPQQRIERGEELMSIPGVEEMDGFKTLATLLFDTKFAQAQGLEKPAERYDALRRLEAVSDAKTLSSDQKKQLGEALKEVVKDPEAKKEAEARKDLEKIRKKIDKYRTDSKKLKKYLKDLEKLATKESETLAGKEAAALAAELNK